ncbi:unnamed protein product [Durusdinium trenchii]|uniref:Uncharacterized protein n=1 Tax=Durusdinium trenchii TaxID=1381693 RepID=A0ABP0NZ01_9DINO
MVSQELQNWGGHCTALRMLNLVPYGDCLKYVSEWEGSSRTSSALQVHTSLYLSHILSLMSSFQGTPVRSMISADTPCRSTLQMFPHRAGFPNSSRLGLKAS